MGIRRAIQNIFNQQNHRPDAQRLLYFLLQQKSTVQMPETQEQSWPGRLIGLDRGK